MKEIQIRLDKKRIYYIIIFAILAVFLGLGALYYFSSGTSSSYVNPDPLEQSIYDQEEIREEIKRVVRKEVKDVYSKVGKEVDNLGPDDLADAINSELSLFRQISTDKQRTTSP